MVESRLNMSRMTPRRDALRIALREADLTLEAAEKSAVHARLYRDAVAFMFDEVAK